MDSRYLNVGGEFPHQIARYKETPAFQKKRICVVGGGVSGLYVAYYLMYKHGDMVTVDVYEASGRVGGRVYTVNDREGTYEAGAGRICIPDHKRTLALLKHFGIQTRPIPPEPPEQHKHRQRLCQTQIG